MIEPLTTVTDSGQPVIARISPTNLVCLEWGPHEVLIEEDELRQLLPWLSRALGAGREKERTCCHDAPEEMHHPRCLTIGSPATRGEALQPMSLERLKLYQDRYNKAVAEICNTLSEIARLMEGK